MRPARRSPALGGAGLGWARLRAHAGLAGGIALTIAVSIALLCGLSAWTSLQTREALRAGLSGDGDSAAWVQVQTRPADDADAQDATARAVFAAVLGDAVVVEGITLGEPGDDGYRVAWRITPDPDSVDAVAVERLSEGIALLPDAFRESGAAVRGVEFTGGLASTLDVLSVGAGASRAIAPVPLALLGILAWFAVFELARLLGSARGREVALLRARGLSAAQGARLAAGEGAVLAGVAGAAGWALALGALLVAVGTAAVAALGETWPLALAVAVLFGGTVAVASSRAARAASTPRASAGRVAAAASGAVAVLVVLAALVLLWQLRTTADASATAAWRVTLVALAPTVAVAGVAVLSVLVLPPLAALVARGVTRGPGLALPARQVARRTVGFSVAVALVAITAAGSTLAAGYIGTWQSASSTAADVAAGAPLRASVPAADMTPALIATGADVEGVSAIAPAIAAPVAFSDTSAALIAVPADRIESLVIEVPGVIDPGTLAATLSGFESGAEVLDPDATGIRITANATAGLVIGFDTVDAPAEAARVFFRAWVVDAAQVPALVELTMTPAPGAVGVALEGVGELPPGSAPWSLIGIDAGIRAASPFSQAVVTGVTVEQLAGDASTPLDVEPVNVPLSGSTARPQALVWTAATDSPDRVPGVVTRELAEALDVGLGDPLDAQFTGTGRITPLTVTEIVDAVPGTANAFAVMVALDAVWATALTPSSNGRIPTLLPPNEAWAAGSASPADLSAALDGAAVSVPGDSAAALTASLVVVWWSAAIGGALLAGIALIAVFTALTSQRAGEVLVLRAVGIAPRRQALLRALEATAVCAFAAILGAAGGLAVAIAVVPTLVAAAVPTLPSSLAVFAVASWPLAATGGCLAVAMVIVVVGMRAAVIRQGGSTRLEEAAA